MIPFWKKTDKGGKKKPPKPAVPRTAQRSGMKLIDIIFNIL